MESRIHERLPTAPSPIRPASAKFRTWPVPRTDRGDERHGGTSAERRPRRPRRCREWRERRDRSVGSSPRTGPASVGLIWIGMARKRPAAEADWCSGAPGFLQGRERQTASRCNEPFRYETWDPVVPWNRRLPRSGRCVVITSTVLVTRSCDAALARAVPRGFRPGLAPE